MNQKVNKVTPWAVLSVSLILTSGMAINGTLPLIKEHLSLSQTQSELLGTIPSLTVFLVVLLSTLIVKKIGMKKTVLMGLSLVAIGGTLPILTPNSYPAILLSRLILGAGLGCYNSSAVNYINELFVGKQRMNLLGMRNSMESIGQMFLTFIAGLLISFGWQFSYLIYLGAIPIAILFYFFVPDVKKEESTTKEKKKITLLPILSVIFASIMVMNSIAIAVRFPALAVALKGATYNTSLYLALMPVLGIISGFLFQKLTSLIKHRILYVAVIINLLANLLIAVSANSFFLLVLGLLISSIPVAWVLPYLFNHIEKISGGMNTRFLTSLIFLGCNFGVLIAPVLMRLFEMMGGTSDLYFPFYVFTCMFLFLLIILVFVHNKVNNKNEKN
ncbi:MFS transporter [Vagococcus carniphilus]|uniref:MFS transporter n=1 Tax=Vagococcus carniphilus TaxID=218144 RepID=A0AAW8U2Y6_9ENTE|nr:MFS transporter [Vagococcus carniphilus]MDT2815486.1 MFS transporter [Vagococcus carniphilus]MDT2833131.1 MFS transporter [Vagococcus carniphilus]MDT2864594.1 MFS transporter [Vagococcus carniphilus]